MKTVATNNTYATISGANGDVFFRGLLTQGTPPTFQVDGSGNLSAQQLVTPGSAAVAGSLIVGLDSVPTDADSSLVVCGARSTANPQLGVHLGLAASTNVMGITIATDQVGTSKAGGEIS